MSQETEPTPGTYVPGTSRLWSKSREFDRLSAKLATVEGRDFEREALPLLRVIWPQARAAPALRSFDRAGADHLVWSDEPSLPLVVQYKGFRSAEHEIGPSQIHQAVASIRSFAASGLRTDSYILVHNRDGRNSDFRREVAAELERLVASGVAGIAELWDRQAFILRAFQALEVRIFEAIDKRARAAREAELDAVGSASVLLDHVPLRDGSFVADQNRQLSLTWGASLLMDPSAMLTPMAKSKANTTLVIGHAGAGKTTAALRSWSARPNATFYVAAARLSKEIRGTKDFVAEVVPDDLFDDMDALDPRDRELHRFMGRPVLASMFGRPELNITLFVDGLDESVFFARTEGLHHLFNLLRDIHISVVLTARSEMWHSRQQDFAISTGAINPTTRRRQVVRLVELLPWTDAEVEALAAALVVDEHDAGRKRALISFAAALQNGDAQREYGDLLYRPLFLRMIIETIGAHAPPPPDAANAPNRRVSRSRLVEQWTRLKVLRDVSKPLRRGGARVPILAGILSADETIRVSFHLMAHAAALMTERDNGAIVLTNACSLDSLLDSASIARPQDLLGITLHTLLVPVLGWTTAQSPRVRFAHRVLQEFFLAWYCVYVRAAPEDAELPSSVREWIDELRAVHLAERGAEL